MKNLFAILIFGIFFNVHLSAQQEGMSDELFEEMERIQKELFQNLQSIEVDSLGYQIYFDTLMVQDFGDFFGSFDESGAEQSLDPQAIEQLFKHMEEQLSQMNSADWNQMGRLFENFGLMPFGSMQRVDPQEDSGIEGLPKKKDGSKRKVYKM